MPYIHIPGPFEVVEQLPQIISLAQYAPVTSDDVKEKFAALRDAGFKELALAVRDEVKACSIRDLEHADLMVLESNYDCLLEALPILQKAKYTFAEATDRHRRTDLPPLREHLRDALAPSLPYLSEEARKEVVNTVAMVLASRRAPKATAPEDGGHEQVATSGDPVAEAVSLASSDNSGGGESFAPVFHSEFKGRRKSKPHTHVRYKNRSVAQTIMDHFTFHGHFTHEDARRWVGEYYDEASYSGTLSRLKGAGYIVQLNERGDGYKGKGGRYRFERDVLPQDKPLSDKQLREEVAIVLEEQERRGQLQVA